MTTRDEMLKWVEDFLCNGWTNGEGQRILTAIRAELLKNAKQTEGVSLGSTHPLEKMRGAFKEEYAKYGLPDPFNTHALASQSALIGKLVEALEDGLRLHEWIIGAQIDGIHPKQLAKNIREALALAKKERG